MEAKDLLSKIIETLMDLEKPVDRKFLMQYICGNESEEMEESGLMENETFGICQGEEESLLLCIVEEAVKKGLILLDDETKTYTFTPAGKKFQKKPKSFPVNYDDEDEDEDATIDSSIDELMSEIEQDSPVKKGSAAQKKSSMKINLIHAIDRKKALDDFAESQGVDFDEILDELESLVHGGTKININYFIEEVLEADAIDELMEIYTENKGDLKATLKEMEDVYNIEELRLVRIKYLCENR